jgi:universal stress protein A
MVLREAALGSVSNILVPVDFSSASKSCVAYATALAQPLHADVTLLHVYEEHDLMESIVPGADNENEDARTRVVAQKRLESLRTTTPAHGNIEMRVMVVHGSPAQEIMSVARNGGFDMIVMGTHGRTGLQRVLMGSVAETVVRAAPCPVLTIHLPSSEGAALLGDAT